MPVFRFRRPPQLPLLVSLFVSVASGFAAAQDRPGAPQPLPDIAPPPPDMRPLDEALTPQVTITRRGEDQVEEFRIKGRLYMVKVTPPHGVPYYLIDERGDGQMIRRDAIDERLVVPMWMILQF